jgi:hypothetical protein
LLTGETLINVVYIILCYLLFIFHISPSVLRQLVSEPNSIVFHNNRLIHCHPSHIQTPKQLKKKKKKIHPKITSPFKSNTIYDLPSKISSSVTRQNPQFCSTQSPIHKHQQTKVYLQENNTNQVTHIPIRAIPYQYPKFIMYHYEYPTINPRSMRQFGSRPFTQQQWYDVPMQVRMDVSNFHGERDPYAFQDWLIALEEYLEWIGLSPDRKVRFVKMKLKGQAHVWWQREEEYLHRLCLPPISI